MSAAERLRSAEARPAKESESVETELGEYGVLVNASWIKTGDAIEVHSPFDDSVVAIVHRAGPEEVEAAITHSVEAAQVTRKMPSWKRAEILEAVSGSIADRYEEFSRTIALEAGKPIRTARAEVDRAVFTFRGDRSC